MYVRHLGVTDFRSWAGTELGLDPGISVLLGANGQGKTNLAEALGYLATLSSHRVATDAPLIRAGADTAGIRAAVVNQGRELTVEIDILAGRANRARVNRAPVRRPRDVLGILRTVLFAPEDQVLVRGDPVQRRRYLDDLMVTRRPVLAAARGEYEKVLRQRGALLKSSGAALRRGDTSTGRASPGPASDRAVPDQAVSERGVSDRAVSDRGVSDRAPSATETLDVWDGQLAAHGARVLAGRLDLLAEIAPHVTEAYASVAPGAAPATMRYRSSLGELFPDEYGRPGAEPADVELLEACMLSELARVRRQEIERGTSLVGPHRDDVELILGEYPARAYASHGESWSYALALRLGAFSLLRTDGTDPVLILDDVFAELDARRRRALAAAASDAEQVIITAAVAQDVPAELSATCFDVQLGAGGSVVARRGSGVVPGGSGAVPGGSGVVPGGSDPSGDLRG